ncbi:uncharacterized protein [Arachis hypogaea]|uniref:uncharacterized protein isoform X2 n=1 Tax=Arachis hypogaea TaxID=3818 RepID=UPI003B21DE28
MATSNPFHLRGDDAEDPSRQIATAAAASPLKKGSAAAAQQQQTQLASKLFLLLRLIANLLDCTSWSGAGPGLMDDVTQGAHQELKANKEELRVEKLKDKEEVEDLTHEMAELRWQEWTFGGWMEVVKA